MGVREWGEPVVGKGAPSGLLAWADFWARKESVSLQTGHWDSPRQLGSFWGGPIGLPAGAEVTRSDRPQE